MAPSLTISNSIKSLMAAVAVLGAYASQPYRVVMVSGNSMAPTYSDWQLIVVDRRIPTLKRNDVVLVRTDSGVILKRIAYTGGDLYVKRATSDDAFDLVQVRLRPSPKNRDLRAVRVPEGEIYLVGDNMSESFDSRSFGTVPVSDVIAWIPDAPLPKGPNRTIRPYFASEIELLLGNLTQLPSANPNP
jgi:signal peptidase I